MQTVYQQMQADLHGKTYRRVNGVDTHLRVISDDAIVLSYRGTSVVTAYRDGHVRLTTDGWTTTTTKERINRYLPHGWYVFQRQWNWYVAKLHDPQEHPFEDGMEIHPSDNQCVYSYSKIV